MSGHGTASEQVVPGWFVEFQLAALRALPRDIDQQAADDWRGKGEQLAKIFREVLIPPVSPVQPIECVRVINETTIEVNLDAPPKLPFNGAEIEFQIGSGWVKVEKHKDGLYVDNRKVILYLSERQKGGKVIQGHELREELSGKPVLHPNIMDALIEHSYLIPENWKVDENGNVRYIFFWAVIFRGAVGGLCVRCFCFGGGRWGRGCGWLGGDWDGSSPAALLAS